WSFRDLFGEHRQDRVELGEKSVLNRPGGVDEDAHQVQFSVPLPDAAALERLDAEGIILLVRRNFIRGADQISGRPLPPAGAAAAGFWRALAEDALEHPQQGFEVGVVAATLGCCCDLAGIAGTFTGARAPTVSTRGGTRTSATRFGAFTILGLG